MPTLQDLQPIILNLSTDLQNQIIQAVTDRDTLIQTQKDQLVSASENLITASNQIKDLQTPSISNLENDQNVEHTFQTQLLTLDPILKQEESKLYDFILDRLQKFFSTRLWIGVLGVLGSFGIDINTQDSTIITAKIVGAIVFGLSYILSETILKAKK